jgi:ArsR family transcriptional regulator, lead/cadmium/zinc/bismuth-responsive transcriptional repressor
MLDDLWNDRVVHLVPTDRRTLEGERVCRAIAALGQPTDLTTWATRFGLLGDRSRLALLVCIAHAGPISVTDLAVATGMNDTTVSQALRLLRAAGTVSTRRDGRIIRYELADDQIRQLLHHLPAVPAQHRHAAT